MQFLKAHIFVRIAALSAAAVLLALLASVPAQRAWAEPSVDEAEAALAVAEAQVAALSAEYAELKADYDELQAQIDEASAKAMEAQEKVIEGRNDLCLLANYKYRTGTVSLLDLVLDAENFGELLKNLAYLASIQNHQTEIIAQHKANVATYQSMLEDLNKQRDEQDARLKELEQKHAEAQQIVAEATAALNGAEATRIAAMNSSVGAMNTDREEPEISPDWNTNPGANESDGGNTSEPGATGWFEGYASAYGGSSDPNTPNPGYTATGAVCDDNSMGVAIPTSWANYKSYLGRTVEICCNGITVLATVNDCGYMGGGARCLDLQPGVFKALGFSDCYDWGVRWISYRFL